MRQAVIVAPARPPIGKAYRGAFKYTQPQTLACHVIAEAVRRGGVEPGEIEDVMLGTAHQQGSTCINVARQLALRAGLPTSVTSMSVDRRFGSEMIAIAIVAEQILHKGAAIAVCDGVGIHLAHGERAHQRFPCPRPVATYWAFTARRAPRSCAPPRGARGRP